MFKWMIALSLLVLGNLQAETKVLAFSGSTREGSINKKLINEIANVARKRGAEVKVIDLKEYSAPFYDADLEASQGMPPKAKELRQLMIQSDVIFIASPEYNGSISAALKNAIDWASRDENKSPSREAFKNKKFALLYATPGPGGARGLVHLREIITNIGGNVMAQQMVVPNSYNALDEQGKLKDPKLAAELQQFIDAALANEK